MEMEREGGIRGRGTFLFFLFILGRGRGKKGCEGKEPRGPEDPSFSLEPEAGTGIRAGATSSHGKPSPGLGVLEIR